MDKKLDALMQRRAAERLAARVVPERVAEFRQERKQTPTPEPTRAASVPVATEKEARHMPTHPAPSMGAGFTSRTEVRQAVAAKQQTERADASAAAFMGGMHKVDPLEKLMAARMAAQRAAIDRNPERPGSRVVLGKVAGLER